METVARRRKHRAFLDAAAKGDADEVETWLSDGARGDVNVTMGEGWTALLYAVAHSRLGIVRRLLEEQDVDLNATTITGSSALTLAINRKNNTLVALLLSSGASRATISNELWLELGAVSWPRADVRQMLSPDWAVVWSPALHRHYPPAEREKCRLLIYANALALRSHDTSAFTTSLSTSPVESWRTGAMQPFWWALSALASASRKEESSVRWRYLPPPLVRHILEYAVFLW